MGPDITVVVNDIAKVAEEVPVIRATQFRIKDLREPISSPVGGQAKTSEGIELTIKSTILIECNSYKCEAPTALRVLSIALKLQDAGSDLVLNEDDYLLVKGIVEKNPAGFGALIHAQVWKQFARGES